MSAIELGMRVEDAASVATTAAVTLGIERASRELFISPNDLELLRHGKLDAVGLGPSLVERVAGWARAHNAELFREAGRPVPPFDHFNDFWENFYGGPREERPVNVERAPRFQKFLDFDITFPFGVPACALTPHSGYVEFFARRGYDLLTYKTVRDRPWHAHPFPQWAFAVDLQDELSIDSLERPVVTSLDPGIGRTALVNSCGVPSLKPHEWQADVAATKRLLRPGQILIVSVMGSREVANDDRELATQFADAATMAVDAGADIVEANMSCPNTGGKIICRSAGFSAEILRAISSRLQDSRTPLFAKISYLDEQRLKEFVDSCAKYLQGIVAINTISVPAVAPDGKPFFGERQNAGLSGPSIRSFGLDVTRRLVELREKSYDRRDWVIVGVGGVSTPADYDMYMSLGADAVQSCSGVQLNPNLAVEIQERDATLDVKVNLAPSDGPAGRSAPVARSTPSQVGSIVTSQDPHLMPKGDDSQMASGQVAVLEALEKNDVLDPIEIAVAARLSPSQSGRVLRALVAKEWVSEDESGVRITRQGRRAYRNLRRTGTAPAPAIAPRTSADELLDKALVALKRHK